MWKNQRHDKSLGTSKRFALRKRLFVLQVLGSTQIRLSKTALRSDAGNRFLRVRKRSQILPPKTAEKNSIIIFDDVSCDSQSIIRDYFCFGRHRHIDCFYLCQTYSSIPKQLIRDNANFIVIFPQDNTNLTHIYHDHVNVDMTFEQFRSLCVESWKDKYGFLVIDKDNEINAGRYRKGFDCYLNIY